MKTCPNCKQEVEENFELCWNCNYSFTEKAIIDIKELQNGGGREVDCLRCKIPLIFSGQYKFHEGPKMGVMGNIFEVFVNRETFDLYICPKCGKVEFFCPVNEEEYKNIQEPE